MRRQKTITTSEICFQTCRGKYKQVFPACIASPLSPSCFKQQGSLLSCSFYPSRLLFSRLGARVHSAWVLPPLAQWGRWCSLARKRTHTHVPLLATGPICGSLKIVNRTALERSAQITSSISSPHRSVIQRPANSPASHGGLYCHLWPLERNQITESRAWAPWHVVSVHTTKKKMCFTIQCLFSMYSFSFQGLLCEWCLRV